MMAKVVHYSDAAADAADFHAPLDALECVERGLDLRVADSTMARACYRSQGIPHIQLADQADSENGVADFETRLRRAHFDIGCADIIRLAQAEALDQTMLDS